jgi:hypothetical protein
MTTHSGDVPSGDSEPGSSVANMSRAPGAEFPAAVYLSVIAAFAWIVLASWLAFGAGAEADLGLGIATVLGLVFFALPIIMFKTAARHFSAERQRLDDFLGAPVDTATGTLTGSQAWLQVLVIPLTLAFAAIAIGAIRIFVA